MSTELHKECYSLLSAAPEWAFPSAGRGLFPSYIFDFLRQIRSPPWTHRRKKLCKLYFLHGLFLYGLRINLNYQMIFQKYYITVTYFLGITSQIIQKLIRALKLCPWGYFIFFYQLSFQYTIYKILVVREWVCLESRLSNTVSWG